jgi:probable HAF family extracellular repeat protein
VTEYADTSSGAFHAFLYSNGQMIDLGTLGGSYSMGRGINNAGQITGFASTSNVVGHAFLYSNGQMTDLGSLGTTSLNVGSSSGHAINNSGQVTGSSSSLLHESTHAFLHSNGQMVDLGSLTGIGGSSDGYAINDEGQVTGYSSSFGGPHGFLYSNGQMVDSNDLIDPALGITLQEATGINNHGQIVANGVGASPRVHAYLLTPVPEPSTWALLSISFLGLLVWSGASDYSQS